MKTETETLLVVLEEGFSHTHVVARVGNQRIYENSAVTTKLLTGRADSFAVPRDASLIEHGITIELPAANIRRSVQVGSSTAALLVSLRNGRLDIIESTQLPGYM